MQNHCSTIAHVPNGMTENVFAVDPLTAGSVLFMGRRLAPSEAPSAADLANARRRRQGRPKELALGGAISCRDDDVA
jgi:hypothetical protein